MTKTEMTRSLLSQNKVKEALREAKGFRIGVTKEQRSVMTRAYECIVYPGFYESIGKNISDCIEAGVEVLKAVLRGAK